MSDPQETTFPLDQPYEGEVIARNDPRHLHRVKVVVPGPWDVGSPWILPFGVGYDGAPLKGSFESPPLGAKVAILFINNNRENPRYLSGGHRLDGIPLDDSGDPLAEITDDGDNKVWQDERVRIERDARGSSYGYRITDLETGTLVLDLDLHGGQVGIVSPLGIRLRSTGHIRIDGGLVTIQGRPVVPGNGSI